MSAEPEISTSNSLPSMSAEPEFSTQCSLPSVEAEVSAQPNTVTHLSSQPATSSPERVLSSASQRLVGNSSSIRVPIVYKRKSKFMSTQQQSELDNPILPPAQNSVSDFQPVLSPAQNSVSDFQPDQCLPSAQNESSILQSGQSPGQNQGSPVVSVQEEGRSDRNSDQSQDSPNMPAQEEGVSPLSSADSQSRIETIFNGLGRNNDGENSYLGSEVTIFSTIGRPLGRKKPSAFHVKKRKRFSRLVLDEQGLAQAHRYVLFNSDEVSPYIKKQEQEIKRRNRRKRFSPFEIHKLQSETFNTWFRDYDERQPGWLTVKHAKLRDLFDMGDASSFEKDEEPEQLGLDDSVDTSISSWIRNDVGADGFDVTPDMENENVEEDPINEQNREAIF
ncbi:hypothetical protein V6N11_028918 [Hibiscus sabdariffa]|uniref:Uncharacterized protein n=1 Tax=Hibiscus sabdariffa TaxID=183260 RepID=A0ABR2ABN6_9ROSI